VLGIADAEHAEYDPGAPTLVITPVACPIPTGRESGPKLAGLLNVRLRADSLAYRIYQRQDIQEEYSCSFGLNAAFRQAMEAGGLRISGLDEQDEVRVVELANHRFFLATLFLPQLRSTAASPHPLVTAFVQAALDYTALGA
jgi:CTP synthase (UTP-ammonia lyase)